MRTGHTNTTYSLGLHSFSLHHSTRGSPYIRSELVSAGFEVETITKDWPHDEFH